MKIKFLSALLFGAIAFSSCSKDDDSDYISKSEIISSPGIINVASIKGLTANSNSLNESFQASIAAPSPSGPYFVQDDSLRYFRCHLAQSFTSNNYVSFTIKQNYKTKVITCQSFNVSYDKIVDSKNYFRVFLSPSDSNDFYYYGWMKTTISNFVFDEVNFKIKGDFSFTDKTSTSTSVTVSGNFDVSVIKDIEGEPSYLY